MLKRVDFVPVPPSVARAAIAHALLGDHQTPVAAPLGTVSLLPHQDDAVQRLRVVLNTTHVAMLADDVGMGKTYVALALARDYQAVRVIAPAALVPMWRTAIARTTCHHVRIESLQRYSRALRCAPFPPNTLVIVDEAHHLRTAATKRYTAVSQAVTGCDLLLLTATPVHNTPRDLRTLLALGLGGGAARLSRALLSSVIVRRTDTGLQPRIVKHPPIRIDHHPALLEAILTLPAPLPAHDGAVAGALIRLGLLRAWCSSDAALTYTLRRRLLRGEALRHALEAGRHPTSAELRTWLVGEHEVQLAFPELVASAAPDTMPLLEILGHHLQAVTALLRLHQAHSDRDHVRADALREVMSRHRDMPVVAFSQYAETVRAISRALADIAGVGGLTGNRAWVASGPITRAEALAQFAPIAQGKPPPPTHQRIRLLLTTDLLAEGVNLQDAGVVVHLDLPWTVAVQRQRVGRCVRVGSPHTEVAVYRFEPHAGAARVLRIAKRLQQKARITTRLVGAPHHAVSAHRHGRPSAADAMSGLRALLKTWAAQSEEASCTLSVPSLEIVVDSPEKSRPTSASLTVVAADREGFVALVRATPRTACADGLQRNEATHARLLVGTLVRSADGRVRIRISQSPDRVHQALRHLDRAAPIPVPACECRAPSARHQSAGKTTLRIAQKAVRRWIARSATSAALSDSNAAVSAVHRRARAALQRSIQRLSVTQRHASRSQFLAAHHMLASARGAAAEREIASWMAAQEGQHSHVWLEAWKRSAVLRRALDSPTVARGEPAGWSVDTLVLLCPQATSRFRGA